ncbi:MAG: (Fe-S)-binding protein [Bacillaceae bacterium]|nr:(Fe-S)-binding protein [Bacillaceae bacterium]
MHASLMITCLSDAFYPRVGISVVHVLEKMGVKLDFPEEQTCCGQPAYNSGYRREALQAAKQMIQAFEHSPYVVTPSGSCAAMIRHYYPDMFAGDGEWEEKARNLADKTYEFSEFLVRVLKVDQIDAELKGKATYHHSCHMMRGLGVKDEPITLLKKVRGLELNELPFADDCCGFGGTFSVKMDNISEAMVDEKVRHIQDTGAEYLIGSDLGCLMNIGGRLERMNVPVKVLHLAEVLAGEGNS